MGTEVLRPHDCLARTSGRRPLRPAAKTAAAARRGHHGHGHGARGDRWASAAPRQVRTKAASTVEAADAYAGPAFGSMSPSPRALPLPRFSSRAASDAAAGVDDSATRELRRLLGLH